MRQGKTNEVVFRRTQFNVRPLMQVALDTQLFQLANYERAAWYSTGEAEWGEREIDTGYLGPAVPDFSQVLMKEVPFLYTLFEMARQGALQLVLLPSVRKERDAARDKHVTSIGCTPLDHDVSYRELEFGCSRMQFSNKPAWGSNINRGDDECQLDMKKYSTIYGHLSGKSQIRDAWHFIICDAFGIDIFLTSDTNFLKAYNQIDARLRSEGVRTRALSPSEFCRECRLWPTHPPQTDSEALFRGVVR